MDFLINIFKVKSFCFFLLLLSCCCELRPMQQELPKEAEHDEEVRMFADLEFQEACPLQYAALFGDRDQIEPLLDGGEGSADRDYSDKSNPLYYAARAGNKETFDVLRAYNIPFSNNLLLFWACRGRNAGIVRVALDEGADPNCVMRAFQELHHPSVRINFLYLMQSDHADRPVFFNALTRENNGEVLKLLISRGADVNLRGTFSYIRNPFHADPEIECTPLMFAILKQRDLNCLRILIGAGADIDACDLSALECSYRATPCKYIRAEECRGENLTRARNYLENEARATQALQQAVLTGDRHSALCALKSGAYVDVQDRQGNTPMHCAARNNDRSMMMLLLLFGPDLLVRNYANQTVLEGENGVGLIETMRELGNQSRLFQVAMRQNQEDAAEAAARSQRNTTLAAVGGVALAAAGVAAWAFRKRRT